MQDSPQQIEHFCLVLIRHKSNVPSWWAERFEGVSAIIKDFDSFIDFLCIATILMKRILVLYQIINRL